MFFFFLWVCFFFFFVFVFFFFFCIFVCFFIFFFFFFFTAQAGADLHYRRRPESVVEEFFRAVPHHLYGLAGGLRQARRLHCLCGGALAAEAAAHIRGYDAHVLRRDPEGLRHLLPHRKRRLRAGPHGNLAVLHRGRGRMGFHRRVRHVVVEVGFLDDCR